VSAPVVEPSACTWCGIARRGHGRQFADAAGWHEWERPSDAQVLARMKARRLALTVARVGALPVPVGPEAQPELALPWAHEMPDGDLSGFLDDLVSAALNRWRTDPDGPVPDRVTLADIERVCREWRTPGVGYRSDPEPEVVPDALTTVFVPVASLREPEGEFYPFLHKGRIPHDLPETGGTQ
jgi:hypothetical protein